MEVIHYDETVMFAGWCMWKGESNGVGGMSERRFGLGEADATLNHENEKNFLHRQSRMNNQASGNLDTCLSTGISPQ